jgi:hypothetical protein
MSHQKQSYGSRANLLTNEIEIIRRSRYGKSTFLEHQILNAPGGFVFLDPHGHSAEGIADTIP